MKCPDDYNAVMLPDLPGDVLSVVRVDANGYPTVYINDALSLPAKRMALAHELWHFSHGDCTHPVTLDDAEKRACHAARIAQLPRRFRAATDTEQARLDTTGAAMFNRLCGDPVFDLPLNMPDPMFDKEPPPPIHGIKWEGW